MKKKLKKVILSIVVLGSLASILIPSGAIASARTKCCDSPNVGYEDEEFAPFWIKCTAHSNCRIKVRTFLRKFECSNCGATWDSGFNRREHVSY